MDDVGENVTHKGACHCGAVQFTVEAPAVLHVWICNCSICTMKQNHHFIVPQSRFTLISGKDKLTEYRFGTQTARHLFCSVCGVQAFYQPRSNPDGYAVTAACILPGTIEKIIHETFDGQQWESQFATSDISKYSKDT